MPAKFERQGIRFQYPESWSLERSVHESGWAATAQSPDTAFLTLSFHADEPDIAVLADSVLETLQQEYPGLEADTALDTLAGQPAIGYDIRFITLDLTNTAWVRSFSCEGGSILVFRQINDLELDRNGDVLKAICRSIEVED